MEDHDSGFKLIITDFGKFKEFISIIRGEDADKLKELTETLKAGNDKTQAAIDAATKA